MAKKLKKIKFNPKKTTIFHSQKMFIP